MSVSVNDSAPDFELSTADGAALRLSALRGRKVVLFFYPRDHTHGCTAQACAFRDAYEELVTAGAEVIGVSSDSAKTHHGFATRHSLPFPIVSDPGGSVRRQYGAYSPLLLNMTGRVTYLINERGMVCDIFASLFRTGEHVKRARAWVAADVSR
jgi:peroxiredoxin Q/BCP